MNGTLNLWFGWAAILTGLLAGAVIGMFFHNETWMGGYDSWRRRMLRLMHISLVGTGLLNIIYALSVNGLQMQQPPRLSTSLLVVGAVTMPAVCGLSAWKPAFRHLFFIPVLSLTVALAAFIYQGMIA